MKKNTFLNIIRVLAVSAVLLPIMAFAQATGTPTFSLLGASNITSNSATVSVSFTSGNAMYHYGEEPTIVVTYTNLSTGVTLVTQAATEELGTTVTPFQLSNLSSSTTYSYYATMTYNGLNYESAATTFYTSAQAPTAQTTTTGITNTYAAPTGSPVASPATQTASYPNLSLQSIFKSISSFGGLGSTTSTSLKSIVETGGYGLSNGVGLSITDSHARVEKGDSVTYTIQYSNGNSDALRAAHLIVQLPDEYTFVSGDANTSYASTSNLVSIYIGTIPANDSGTILFTAEGTGTDNASVQTQANLIYTGGSVTAVDRDTYVGGSQSVLGASVFGVGFFPQTFFGWLLIIIILVIIIVAARRYMTKVNTPPKK